MTPINETAQTRHNQLGWAAAFALGLALILSLIYFESFFGASFYVLSNRNMSLIQFTSSLISGEVDLVVWVACLFTASGCLLLSGWHKEAKRAQSISLPLAIIILTLLFGALNINLLAIPTLLGLFICCTNARIFSFSVLGMLKRVLLGIAAFLLVIEVGSFVLYNLPYVFNLGFASSALAEKWRLVEMSLSNAAYPLLPYGYLVFILLGIAAFLVELVRSQWLSEKLGALRLGVYLGGLSAKFEQLKTPEYEPRAAKFPLALALVISFVISIFLVEVTLFPWFNPTYRLVAVDAPPYYQWLDHMRGLDPASAVQFAFHNDRALFLASSYALSFIMNPVSVIQLAAAFLIPIFCIVSLYLVRAVCGLRETWVYLVLLVPLSLQALALIYSGYFGNMLAAIFVYLYFAVFLRFNSFKNLRIIPLLLASLGVLFSHSWTWYIFVVALVGFLLLEWRNSSRGTVVQFKNRVYLVVLTVVSGLVADFARSFLVAKSSAGLVVFETASSGLAVPNVDFILKGLNLTTNFYLGGVFSNALIIGLMIVGFLFLLSYKSTSTRLLTSWLVVGCVAVLFASGEYVFNRFMFLMPSLIFSALGFAVIMRYGIMSADGSKMQRLAFEALLAAFMFLFLSNFALGYLTSINIL